MRKNLNQLLLFLILGIAGCVSTPSSVDPAGVLLGPKPRFEEMKSFQRIIRTTVGSADYEKARIDYLLERLGESPYNFVRNGTVHSNTRAVMHLRWKYMRFHKEAPTAEAFADRLASNSKQTGREYTMRIPPSGEYPLRTVLHNELKLLDQGIIEYRDSLKKIEASAETSTNSKNPV